MSVLSVVAVPEGIAMAADSRLTRRRGTKNQNGAACIVEYTLSDNVQKLVLLSKTPVGIGFVGKAIINGRTVSDYLRLFEIECVEKDDTPEMVASKLFRKRNECPETLFYVCGYNNDEPFVYLIGTDRIVRRNVSADNRVIYTAAWTGEKEALAKLVNADPVMNIDMDTMPLKDAIDFSEFMVDVTIKYQRFSDRIQTCGGPIDVLVLTKDGAFWYRNKLKN